MAHAKPTTLAGNTCGITRLAARRLIADWPRWIARDPAVSPWLLLDQLTEPQNGLPGRVQLRAGTAADPAIRQQSHG